MKGALTELNIMKDWLSRIVKDIETFNAAMIENDVTALRALLRYFQHIRSCSAYESASYKCCVAYDVCTIMELYLTLHNETEV